MRAHSRLLFYQTAHLYPNNVELGTVPKLGGNLHHYPGHVPSTWKTGILCAEGTVLEKPECGKCWEDCMGLTTFCRMEDQSHPIHVVRKSLSPKLMPEVAALTRIPVTWGHSQHSTVRRTLSLRALGLQGNQASLSPHIMPFHIVHGVLKARILKGLAVPFSSGREWQSSRSWWWTGKPGVPQSMVSQSRTRLSNWTDLMPRGCRPWSLFFFPFIFISWRLITLQYCSGFCHTLTWISHGFTMVSFLKREKLLSLPWVDSAFRILVKAVARHMLPIPKMIGKIPGR